MQNYDNGFGDIMSQKNNKSESNSEPTLEEQFRQFKQEMDSYKVETEEFIDSANFLFETIYLDHKMNRSNDLMADIQYISIELLEFIGNVCEKHGLEWWLDYGNLLGAVRHGYYVPWDDDVDIGMMREDYLKFDKIITREVKEYGLDDIIEVGYRPQVGVVGLPKFIQVYVKHEVAMMKNARPVLGNVDVFPYDYIKEYDEETLEDVFVKSKQRYFHHKKNYYNLQYCLDTYYEDLNLTYEPTDGIIPGCEGGCGPGEISNLAVLDVDKIFPLGEIKFGDKTFPCPKDPDYHLNAVYGNYLSIPKSLYRHNQVGIYRYNEDNDDVFKKCINRIKEVNAEFNR